MLLAAILAGCEGPGAGKVAFVGGTLWDGTGSPPILDAVIIVNGATIEDAGPPDLVDIPRGADVRRLDGRWVIPGLIDAHTHLQRWMLEPLIGGGVTTVRDMGGNQDSVLTLADALSLGTILGPRVFASGAVIDGSPPIVSDAEGVRTGEEARRAVDDRRLVGATQAAIGPRITRRILRELIHEAKLLRLPVAAHVGKVNALTAAESGVVSIEHLSGVVESTVSNPGTYYRAYDRYDVGWKVFLRGWNTVDSASLDRTARRLAASGVIIVPTLIHLETFARLRDRNLLDTLNLSTVPEQVVNRWEIPRLVRRSGITAADFRAFQRGRAKQDLFVRRFKEAGGSIVAGSNSPHPLLGPGSSLHEELQLLVNAGFSPREALLAATRDAAKLLEADSLGVIRAGSVADFVVLQGNPLEDIGAVKKIDYVVFRGATHEPVT